MNRSIFSTLAGVAFFGGLILAFAVGPFLPFFMAGLAFSSLFGSMASGKFSASYGGLYPFAIFMTLAVCFYTGNWTWVLAIPLAMIILGSFQPRQGRRRAKTIPVYTPPPAQTERRSQPEVPYYQPTSQVETPIHQTYDQGYQPARNQERQHPTYHDQREEYEQPQALYPQQPMPPQQ